MRPMSKIHARVAARSRQRGFILWGGSGKAQYNIERSIRLRASAGGHLTRTPSVTGDTRKFKLVIGFKLGQLGTSRCLFWAGVAGSSNNMFAVQLRPDDTLQIVHNVASTTVLNKITTQVFRDPLAHGILEVEVDTTQAVAEDRVKVLYKGERVTSFSSNTILAQNSTTFVNDSANQHKIGCDYTTSYYDGLLCDFFLFDGHIPASSALIEADPLRPQRWQRKEYTGGYAGTNTCRLKFNDNTSATTLCYDTSGNGNHWTPNNISTAAGSTYDSLTDTPTNNFATLNPLDHNGATYLVAKDGNLTADNTGAAAIGRMAGTIVLTSGQWQFEATRLDAAGLGNLFALGVKDSTAALASGTYGGAPTSTGASASEWVLTDRGVACNTTTYTDLSGVIGTVGQSDVVRVFIDMDSKKLWFGKNATISGDPTAGTGEAFSNLPNSVALVHFSNTSSGVIVAYNAGQQPMAYSGHPTFKTICTGNLPEPLITNPRLHHDVVLVTKSGNTAFTIPWADTYDTKFVIKRRDASGSHYVIDTLRGVNKYILTDSTAAEVTDANVLSVSGTTGTLLSTLADGQYVVEMFKAGLVSARATNTSGSITSTVSANPIAGFSIVQWNGSGAAATIGHGLGVVPKLIRGKPTGAISSWCVYHVALGSTKMLRLESTSAELTRATWNNTTPTSAVFNVGVAGPDMEGAVQHIAYCHAEIPGYSKFDKHTGNASADGPFDAMGISPDSFFAKRADAAQDWYALDYKRDPYNISGHYILLNSSAAEVASAGVLDVVSGGVKIKDTGGGFNASGGTYIYAAIGLSQKYSNAR